jgi:hypothetical protein
MSETPTTFTTRKYKPRTWEKGEHGRHKPWQHHDPAEVGGLHGQHPAILESRTLYPSTVVNAKDSPRVLVSGINSRKIGKRVTKGRWKGMPLYTLTMEERATCPTTCAVWTTCYGNGMHYARRHRPGPDLEDKIIREVDALSRKHTLGFVVRLHVLGDFYSPQYVWMWRALITTYPQLHIFGFTAHTSTSEIGAEIDRLNFIAGGHCHIRFSKGLVPDPGAAPIAETIDYDPKSTTYNGGIICPAQTNKTPACATCGLCWTTTKPIVFLLHGRPAAKQRKKPKMPSSGGRRSATPTG